MKLEQRKFKEISHLVLVPETLNEVNTLGDFFGGASELWEGDTVVAIRLCTDDSWKPYLRIETNEAITKCS